MSAHIGNEHDLKMMTDKFTLAKWLWLHVWPQYKLVHGLPLTTLDDDPALAGDSCVIFLDQGNIPVPVGLAESLQKGV